MDKKFIDFLLFYKLHKVYKTLKCRKKGKNRRWWVRKINLSRDIDGYFTSTFQKIKMNDPEQFFKHTRMTIPVYQKLLDLLKSKLTKSSLRASIEPECRLAITLSYLSQGVSQQYLAWSFKVGKATVHNIIEETCEVIWDSLSDCYVNQPNEENYIKIAKDFEKRCNIPNCLGAIDGKHISIQCPPKSGSMFYNYKKYYSIVLLAVCNASYIFTMVDVGAYGQSDGGILGHSNFGKKLFAGDFLLPKDKYLPKSNIAFPYFFIGDPAFPLKNCIMKPYGGKNLIIERRVFNYLELEW